MIGNRFNKAFSKKEGVHSSNKTHTHLLTQNLLKTKLYLEFERFFSKDKKR